MPQSMAHVPHPPRAPSRQTGAIVYRHYDGGRNPFVVGHEKDQRRIALLPPLVRYVVAQRILLRMENEKKNEDGPIQSLMQGRRPALPSITKKRVLRVMQEKRTEVDGAMGWREKIDFRCERDIELCFRKMLGRSGGHAHRSRDTQESGLTLNEFEICCKQLALAPDDRTAQQLFFRFAVPAANPADGMVMTVEEFGRFVRPTDIL